MSTAKGAAGVIAALLETHAGLALPVRLRAWDGSEAGPADGRMGVDQILAVRPVR